MRRVRKQGERRGEEKEGGGEEEREQGGAKRERAHESVRNSYVVIRELEVAREVGSTPVRSKEKRYIEREDKIVAL
jgi:hypothetical protein